MKLVEPPKTLDHVKHWSITVHCQNDGCNAGLIVDEMDLFQLEMGDPLLIKFGTKQTLATVSTHLALFKCPCCGLFNVVDDYLNPEVLPFYAYWYVEGTSDPEQSSAFTLYRSKYSEFNVIHLSREGARLLYVQKIEGLQDTIATMEVPFSFFKDQDEQYRKTKDLLDRNADVVFADPQYPLNGLKRLYEYDPHQLKFDLAERYRQQREADAKQDKFLMKFGLKSEVS